MYRWPKQKILKVQEENRVVYLPASRIWERFLQQTTVKEKKLYENQELP